MGMVCEVGMSIFGENVRWLRTRAGLSQAELADKIRVHRRRTTASYISRIETGGIDPRLSTVYSIARALRVRVGILLTPPGDAHDLTAQYLALTLHGKREVRRMMRWWAER